MPGDALYRTGRGGAGNFAPGSQEDNPETTTGSTPQRAPSPDHPQASHAGWSRSGRGGAGNVHDAAADGIDPPEAEVRAASAAVAAAAAAAASAATSKPPASRLGGRGGAGNRMAGDGAHEDDEIDRERKHELDSRVIKDVEAELAVPPKIYRSRSREGRKPDVEA